MTYIFLYAIIECALSAMLPVNEYIAINQFNQPNMMMTASGGRVRIKEIAATTFRPYDINVCRLEPVGPFFRISFANGFLFVEYGRPLIKKDYFPHTGFHFSIVKIQDAYKITLYGIMCLEVGVSVAPSAGREIFLNLCNQYAPFQLFNIRKLEIDMSEMVRTGLTFGYQLRAVRQKNFYGSNK
eukprot:jgi/Antlo1/955/1060